LQQADEKWRQQPSLLPVRHDQRQGDAELDGEAEERLEADLSSVSAGSEDGEEAAGIVPSASAAATVTVAGPLLSRLAVHLSSALAWAEANRFPAGAAGGQRERRRVEKRARRRNKMIQRLTEAATATVKMPRIKSAVPAASAAAASSSLSPVATASDTAAPLVLPAAVPDRVVQQFAAGAATARSSISSSSVAAPAGASTSSASTRSRTARLPAAGASARSHAAAAAALSDIEARAEAAFARKWQHKKWNILAGTPTL